MTAAGPEQTSIDQLVDSKPGDIAQVLRDMEPEAVWSCLAQLPSEKAALALHRLDEEFRGRVLESTHDPVFLKYLLELLDTDEAADLIAQLPAEESAALLDSLSRADEVEQLLTYPPDSAGGIMDTHLLVARLDDTVAEATAYLRRHAADIDQNHDLWVVDEQGHLAGFVGLPQLLISPETALLGELAERDFASVGPETDQEQAAHMVERYDLAQLAVVDEAGQLLGQITSEDAITVLKRESSEDLQRMSGLSAAVRRNDSTLRMVYSRLPWLAVGMLGSVLGAAVIMRFEAALEQAAILAAFIPLIAATAGSAGIQSSTVTVQSIATGELGGSVLGRLLREFRVAVVNGLSISALLGLFMLGVHLLLPDRLESIGLLFLTLGVSLLGVLAIATLIGATMPLLLHRLKIDPAVSTGPFITVSADVIGILFYFMVADLIYL
ncbi:MAG: magnesium transporter [Halieaceae bacterium]|jgi:magnesium transporter|nr:magnesium transporter [Halieaceae bacterium]